MSKSSKRITLIANYNPPSNDIISATTDAGSVTQEMLGAYHFMLADTPELASYKALWDQYRINWVKLWFTPMMNSKDFATGGDFRVQPFYTCVDYNDSATPANTQEVMNYANAVRHTAFQKPFFVFLRPHFLTMVYQSAIATSYKSCSPDWLDTASDSIPHYAVKFGCEGMAFAGASLDIKVFAVSIKMSISFKSNR